MSYPLLFFVVMIVSTFSTLPVDNFVDSVYNFILRSPEKL